MSGKRFYSLPRVYSLPASLPPEHHKTAPYYILTKDGVARADSRLTGAVASKGDIFQYDPDSDGTLHEINKSDMKKKTSRSGKIIMRAIHSKKVKVEWDSALFAPLTNEEKELLEAIESFKCRFMTYSDPREFLSFGLKLKKGDMVQVCSSALSKSKDDVFGMLMHKGPLVPAKGFEPKGTWFGVILSTSCSKTSGRYKGHIYFDCDPECAVFVAIDKLIPVHTPRKAEVSHRQAKDVNSRNYAKPPFIKKGMKVEVNTFLTNSGKQWIAGEVVDTRSEDGETYVAVEVAEHHGLAINTRGFYRGKFMFSSNIPACTVTAQISHVRLMESTQCDHSTSQSSEEEIANTKEIAREEERQKMKGRLQKGTSEKSQKEHEKKMQNLSYRLRAFCKAAQNDGYTLEDVKTAWDIMERESEPSKIIRELKGIAFDITQEFSWKYGVFTIDYQSSDIVSQAEIHHAWLRNRCNRKNTAAECVELLYKKVEYLHAAYQNVEKINVVYALMENDFNLHQARQSLDKQHSHKLDVRIDQEWSQPIWSEGTTTFTAKLRKKKPQIGDKLMAEHGISRAAVDTVFSLREEHELSECIEAVNEMGSNLQQAQNCIKECVICFTDFGIYKMLTLPLCQCHLCTECVSGHFTVLAQTTSCMNRFVCPACNEPDLEHCSTEQYEAHFSLLSGMLKSCLAKKDYELYQQKLFNWGLIADVNFRWCAHGCGAGFINERVGVQKVQCPECKQFQCFDCMKPWLDQHDDSTCDEFDAWKKANDPEFQQQGLAAHLKENGINCPKCKMRYELAKGGCMHFKCPHCRHEFCCGCNLPFLHHPMCQKLPSCKGKGLHAHHPRDCFYYLRDEECKALQQLLMKYKVDYNQPTNVVAADNGKGTQVCLVKEQHEGPNGLEDAICGKALKDQCGLCENHYKEYLVGLINQNNIDPVDILDAASLEATLRKNDKKIPNQVGNEADAAYCDRLRQEVQQQLPLRPRNAQGVQGVAAGVNQFLTISEETGVGSMAAHDDRLAECRTT